MSASSAEAVAARSARTRSFNLMGFPFQTRNGSAGPRPDAPAHRVVSSGLLPVELGLRALAPVVLRRRARHDRLDRAPAAGRREGHVLVYEPELHAVRVARVLRLVALAAD